MWQISTAPKNTKYNHNTKIYILSSPLHSSWCLWLQPPILILNNTIVCHNSQIFTLSLYPSSRIIQINVSHNPFYFRVVTIKAWNDGKVSQIRFRLKILLKTHNQTIIRQVKLNDKNDRLLLTEKMRHKM